MFPAAQGTANGWTSGLWTISSSNVFSLFCSFHSVCTRSCREGQIVEAGQRVVGAVAYEPARMARIRVRLLGQQTQVVGHALVWVGRVRVGPFAGAVVGSSQSSRRTTTLSSNGSVSPGAQRPWRTGRSVPDRSSRRGCDAIGSDSGHGRTVRRGFSRSTAIGTLPPPSGIPGWRMGGWVIMRRTPNGPHAFGEPWRELVFGVVVVSSTHTAGSS